MKQPSIHIDLYEDTAVIYKGDSEFEMDLDKHQVEEWAKVQLPDFFAREKDPDDGLAVTYIEDEYYSEVVEQYVLNREEQWKQVVE